jgi:thioredoxin reductase (NADPH)
VTQQLQAPAFPDLDDPILFPRLSEAKLERLSQRGARRHFEPGEELFAQGVRDAPFYVVERGAVDFFDVRPEGEVHFSRMDVPSFIGDIAMFTGEPTIARCVAAEPTDVIAFDRGGLRAMLAEWPEFSELVLQTMTARRAWLEGEGLGVLRLIAPRDSRRAFEVRDLLERNLLPVRWYDSDSDPQSAVLLETLHIPREETPVLVRNEGVLRNPSAAQVARLLGLRAEVDGQRFDLVVLGAGPAGLAAAVYGGSEGLRTLVAEAWAPGGQAGTSIENYLGFPAGVSGTELARAATLQARRFDAVLSSFHPAVEVVEGGEGLVRVDLDDGQHVLARTLVVATGARWRRLDGASGWERFENAGVYYTASATDAVRCAGEDVIVVGGGNSAGQAAGHLARQARSVTVVVRRAGLKETMSRYLVDRLEHAPNVEILGFSEVVAFHGERGLREVTVRDRRDGSERRLAATAVFAMIGARRGRTRCAASSASTRRASWSRAGTRRTTAARGAGPSRGGSRSCSRTVRPGIFVAGDARAGSAKRVAGAVGDGAMAVRFVHEVLDGRVL